MEPVSVILPTFNRAQLLKRAIDSVLSQDLFAGELIVIDDGSTDDTAKVMKTYTQKGNLHYIKQKNCGPASARNHGVALARYDLIAFLDSDDHWKKEKLAQQVPFLLKNAEYAICHTDEKWLRRGKHLNKKKIHYPRNGDVFSHCLQICGVGMSTVLMKKELYLQMGGLDTSMRCCEDYDFWLRVAAEHHFLLLDDQLTIKEGGREDQLSFLYRIGMDKYRIYAIDKLLRESKLDEDKYVLALNELQKKCKIYGIGCLKYGKMEEADYYLRLPEKYTNEVFYEKDTLE